MTPRWTTPRSCRVEVKFSDVKLEGAQVLLFSGSLLPVFEFIDARLRRGHGGEVRIEATSMWVGAQAWG